MLDDGFERARIGRQISRERMPLLDLRRVSGELLREDIGRIRG